MVARLHLSCFSCLLSAAVALAQGQGSSSHGVKLPKAGFYKAAAVEHDFRLPNDVVLPRKLDLRPYFPVPQNQGHQASCTAWAMGYALATFRHNWERGVRPDKHLPPDPAHVYSPGFLFNMVKQYEQPDPRPEGCLSGVDMGATFTIACEWGNCSWASYPYNSSNNACKDPLDTTVIVKASAWKLPTPVALWRTRTSKGPGPTELPFDPVQWKYHLARKEPVVASFSIDCTFYNGGREAWAERKPFVWDVDSLNKSDTCYTGHAMVCTGYDDRDSTFTFQNSFGVQWGDSGYVKVTHRTLRAAVWEAYIFSQQWWRLIPVPIGKPQQTKPVVDSTYSGSIKPKQVLRFHDLEVRVVTISPDERNIVVQFSDTAFVKPVKTMEFPRGVKRSFVYEDKLWSFIYFEPSFLGGLVSNALPFVVMVDSDADEQLQEAMEKHLDQWRSAERDP
ncbi:MAG: C1 family peptidase [Flavobacteriales bacterium]